MQKKSPSPVNYESDPTTMSPALMGALNALEDTVIILDKEWRYLFVNEAGWRVLTHIKKDVLGKNFWELLPHLKESRFGQVAHEAMRRQSKMEVEEYYPLTDKYFLTKLYPSEHSLVLHATDITDLVRARQMNNQLMGDLQEAMEVYWSKENQALRKSRRPSPK